MIEVSDSIKMQARETAGNDSTPVVDVLSKVRRDTLKIVEDMWRAGEVGDDVFVMTTRIFQDSIKAEIYRSPTASIGGNIISYIYNVVHYMLVYHYAKEEKRTNIIDIRYLAVDEQVTIILSTVTQDKWNRVVQERFQHSGQTISYYSHRVLQAILQLEPLFLQPASNETPAHIASDTLRFYLYFKDCVRAIDGTHVSARVRSQLHNHFRKIKYFLSQNVMDAVGFDMRFHFVLTGWEGFASDSKVLYDAISNEGSRLTVLEGKYYLVDGGYPTIRGFIGPHRRVRYHLNEFTSGPRAPQNHNELFNKRHSTLRNVVGRTFGLWKVDVVIACAILQNYIMMTRGADSIKELCFRRRVESQLVIVGDDGFLQLTQGHVDHDIGVNMRDAIATQLWEA
ncbi:uncharacterized protein LOC105420565 [Amborella trichopoda]|uniref:uncharacterized protein LOC105420565 n=1 Tax=Amborella trichopoda TaxID=13333 RepID=UPI0005D33194|nr:uncharacterized protein LOC105420565 [Amborella trichopoda]|eukprot:XP_011622943.1 uncharacterized protein LOC105420565 [Amborella trichopoda]